MGPLDIAEVAERSASRRRYCVTAASSSPRPTATSCASRIAEKRRELDDEIVRLTRMRDSLAHAEVCTHTPLVEYPEFKARIAEVDRPDSLSGAKSPGRGR